MSGYNRSRTADQASIPGTVMLKKIPRKTFLSDTWLLNLALSSIGAPDAFLLTVTS